MAPSIVGDEWKTAYSAGFNSTTCARVRLEEMKAENGGLGKMGNDANHGRNGRLGFNLRATGFAVLLKISICAARGAGRRESECGAA